MKKLLVCDVEGTIFKAKYRIHDTEYASTMWQPLALSLGENAVEEERLSHIKWESHGYENYIDWVEDTFQIHKKYGLKKEIFEELIRRAEYMDGVIEFFRNLDREKYIPVFISGGFQELIRRAQQELGIPHGHAACEYIFDQQDGLLITKSLVPCDFEGKYDYVKALFKQYDLNAQMDWIFIGDGKNDCSIAQKAPVSIAINAHKSLQEIATYTVDNFFEIAEIIKEIESPIVKQVDEENNDILYVKNEKEKVKSDTDHLRDRILQLEKENKFLKQENNDLKFRRLKRMKKELYINETDYLLTPKFTLSELLDQTKVVFVGLKEDYEQFRFLAGYHKNLRVVALSEITADFKEFRDVDILFVFTSCISHKMAEKAKREIDAPYVHLKQFRNIDMLVKALSNIIYREII